MAAKEKQMLYTQEGFKALKEEYDRLIKHDREEVKHDLSVARSFGDLSENSEYDEARTRQAKIEARIKELDELIANAEIVDESKIDTSVAGVGSTVKVYFIGDDETEEYHIVGSNEADPINHKISDQSPIGKGLIENKAKSGDELFIETPAGTVKVKVLDIHRTK